MRDHYRLFSLAARSADLAARIQRSMDLIGAAMVDAVRPATICECCGEPSPTTLCARCDRETNAPEECECGNRKPADRAMCQQCDAEECRHLGMPYPRGGDRRGDY